VLLLAGAPRVAEVAKFFALSALDSRKVDVLLGLQTIPFARAVLVGFDRHFVMSRQNGDTVTR
jgi:hypothetical protein